MRSISFSPNKYFLVLLLVGFFYFSKKVRFLKEVSNDIVTLPYLLSQIADNSSEIQKAEVSVYAGS